MANRWVQRLRARLGNDPRLQRMVHGSLSGLLGRGLTLAVSAFTLPLTLRYLGPLQYGIWVTVSTSVVMLSVLDLGIANTLTGLVAVAHAKGDQVGVQRYFATAFWVTMAFALFMVPVGFSIWRSIDWGGLFRLSDPVLAAHAARCVAVAGLVFLLSLPLTLANRVLIGFQRTHLVNYFAMVNSLFGLIAIATTILLRGSLVTLMAAYSGSMMLGTLALNLWFLRRPELRPGIHLVRRQLLKELFGQGILFFVLQLTGLVVFNCDNLVIAHYLGAAAVTPYSVAWRLSQYSYLLQGILIPSLWPAFTEAYQKGHMEWIAQTYYSVRRTTWIAVGVAAVCVGLFGRSIIRIWAGPVAVPGTMLLWTMALFSVLLGTTTNQALLLTATGRLRLEAGVAVLAAMSNLLLSIALVQRMGAEGVILSTVCSFLIFMVVPQAWEVKRVLSGRYLAASTKRGAMSL